MTRTCTIFVLLCLSIYCCKVVIGQVTPNGIISQNEYGEYGKLTKSLNSEWYSSASDTYLCVGVEVSGPDNLTNVLVALTFDANPDLFNQQNADKDWTNFGTVHFDVPANFFVFCQHNGPCMITDYSGYPVGPGYISSQDRSSQVLEFCLHHPGMSLSGSPVVYFQGRIIDDSGFVKGYSPDSYFYGLFLDDRVPAGLDANWYSFPYAAASSGNWSSTVNWFPEYPSNTQLDVNWADTHVVLLYNVNVTTNNIFIAHLTQLNGASLTIDESVAEFKIGNTPRNSYWSYGDTSSFISTSTSQISFLTPVIMKSFTNASIMLPVVEIDSLAVTDQMFSVPSGWNADTLIMQKNAIIPYSATSLKVLRYASSIAYFMGKEFPLNSTVPLTLILDNGAIVSATPPANFNSTISTLILYDEAQFIYGGSYATSDEYPQLFITNEIQLNGDATLHISAYVYAPSLSDSAQVACADSNTPLVRVRNGSIYQTWPPLYLDETPFTGEYLKISQDTVVTVTNGLDFANFSWLSDVAGQSICNYFRCSIPAQDDYITITAIGNQSNCQSTKQFRVSAFTLDNGSGKDKSSNIAPIVGAVAGGAGVALLAAVAVVIVKRRKSGQKHKDIEMSQKQTPYDQGPDTTEPSKTPENEKRQSSNSTQALIDPKYEIPYKEITFGPELGRGAFGVVFKCRWRNTDTVVKQMDINKSDKASVELFLKEAANVLKLRTHPNVCSVFGVCTDPQYPICILMEFLPDGSLDNLIYENKIAIDVKTVLELARDIASGMSHLHAENVLHCDLACRNLLVTTVKDKHVVKIADFGLSRVTDKDTYNASVSATFPIRWTAPETLRSGKISRASDIWSYGVVLWEIIEGKRPYPELSNTEVMKAVCDKGYRLPRPDRIEIPTTLWHLMQDCWDENPTQRPNFDTIYNRLEEIGKEFWNMEENKDKKEAQVAHPTNYETRDGEVEPEDTKYTETNIALYGNQMS